MPTWQVALSPGQLTSNRRLYGQPGSGQSVRVNAGNQAMDTVFSLIDDGGRSEMKPRCSLGLIIDSLVTQSILK